MLLREAAICTLQEVIKIIRVRKKSRTKELWPFLAGEKGDANEFSIGPWCQPGEEGDRSEHLMKPPRFGATRNSHFCA